MEGRGEGGPTCPNPVARPRRPATVALGPCPRASPPLVGGGGGSVGGGAGQEPTKSGGLRRRPFAEIHEGSLQFAGVRDHRTDSKQAGATIVSLSGVSLSLSISSTHSPRTHALSSSFFLSGSSLTHRLPHCLVQHRSHENTPGSDSHERAGEGEWCVVRGVW